MMGYIKSCTTTHKKEDISVTLFVYHFIPRDAQTQKTEQLLVSMQNRMI